MNTIINTTTDNVIVSYITYPRADRFPNDMFADNNVTEDVTEDVTPSMLTDTPFDNVAENFAHFRSQFEQITVDNNVISDSEMYTDNKPSDNLDNPVVESITVKDLKNIYKTFKEAKVDTNIKAKSWQDLADKLNNMAVDDATDNATSDTTDDTIITVESLKNKYKTFKEAKSQTDTKARSWQDLADKLNNPVVDDATNNVTDVLKQCVSDAADEYILTNWTEDTLRTKYKTFKDAKADTGIKARSWFALALALNGKNKSKQSLTN